MPATAPTSPAHKPAAPARPATLAEALDSLRSVFEADAKYKRKALAETRANFDRRAEADILDAIETYAAPLAGHRAIVEVWDAVEAAYDPTDETGATWRAIGELADRMILRLLSDAAHPCGSSSPIRNALEARKAAGRAEAVREVRDLAAFAAEKLAGAVAASAAA